MKTLRIFKGIPGIFLASILYFGVFYILYTTLHTPIVSLLSIVLVSYFAWSRGTIPGLVLSVLDIFWTGLTITLVSPEGKDKFSPEAVFSVLFHLLFAFLLGYFGRLARRLQLEINERKKAEAMLKHYQNELEERVRLRTKELEAANARLHHVEKMESIGQLAGGIAHDFNNHLQVILGNCTLIIKDVPEQSPVNVHAQMIRESVKTSSQVIAQLLTFARKDKFEVELICMNDLVQGLVSLLSGSIGKNVVLKFAAEPDLPRIRGGASPIKNALLNLAVNARDAMAPGGTLTFSTGTTIVTTEYCGEKGVACDPGRYVAVSVADTGTGIAPEVISRMFEPFFTTKPEGKGTGMGLAAVYGIAQSHHGAVFASTQIGLGTTFTMLFPAVAEG